MKSRPTHAEVTDSNRRAQAPYNFVPLPETVLTVENLPPHDVYHNTWPTGGEKRYNGYLDCTLKTLTPFYTRCMMNPDFFKEWGETAFYDLPPDKQEERAKPFVFLDVPVIPGSSLRGMVRNLVEIVGYGKMAWVTNQQLSFRSVDTTNLGEYYRGRIVKDEGKRKVIKQSKRRGKPAIHSTPLVRAGYLEKQGVKWAIRPAQNIGGASFARILEDEIPQNLLRWYDCQNAYEIWVKLGKHDYQDVKGGFIQLKYTPVIQAGNSQQPGYQKAVLVYSGEMDKKKHEAIIFPPDSKAQSIDIDDKLIDAYEAQISQEQENLLGAQGALNSHQPVFYLIENNKLVFFGHVMMFRLPYPSAPLDFVPEDLRDPTQTDLAEAIFGYVDGEEREPAYASRVFFSDARFEKPAPDGVWKYNQPITPQALSSPKPTTFQHYLTQDNPNDKKNLNHYATSPGKTTIRGHKLYWHRGQIGLDNIEEKDRDKIEKSKKQYTRIQPVKPEVNFRFKVYFENLSQTELGLLLWVLDLPKGHHHKLGMGKPLGLGSVAISPKLYLCDRQKRYTNLLTTDDANWETGFDQPIPQTAPSDDDLSLESLKKSFEQAIMSHLEQAEVANQGDFRDQERIQNLLKLLEWPGPDRKSTDYMTIQPENQFKERLVLPTPLDYAPSSPPRQKQPHPTPRKQTQASTQRAQSSQSQAQSAVVEMKSEEVPQQKPPPAADPVKIPEVGEVFTGEIVRITDKGDVIVRYKSMPAGQVYASIPAANVEGKQYQVGNRARCEVVEKYQEDGGWVLVCKPGAKPRK